MSEALENSIGALALALTDEISAALKTDGFARIGLTKLLTTLLGNPYPGNHADAAVVLEVEEQVF